MRGLAGEVRLGDGHVHARGDDAGDRLQRVRDLALQGLEEERLLLEGAGEELALAEDVLDAPAARARQAIALEDAPHPARVLAGHDHLPGAGLGVVELLRGHDALVLEGGDDLVRVLLAEAVEDGRLAARCREGRGGEKQQEGRPSHRRPQACCCIRWRTPETVSATTFVVTSIWRVMSFISACIASSCWGVKLSPLWSWPTISRSRVVAPSS